MFENRLTDRIIYDREYMERLIRENYDEIYRYCWRHTGQRETAEDLTQEVFLKFLGNIGRYREFGKLRNYLYVIAGNLIRDCYRKKKETYLEEADEEAAETELEQAVERIEIRKALDSLEAEERDLVILRYYQELKIRDISAVTGIPPSTVRYRLKQAERKLKETLCSGGEREWTED